jgi:tetratricopeptide (TPR) repeat protein
MKTTQPPFPPDATGRLVGVLFLALIPLVTLIPYNTPETLWLTQDLLLRWSSAAVFFLCLGQVLFNRSSNTVLSLEFPNLVFLLLTAWVLLSVINSKEAFDSFYAYRSFLALVLWWFSLQWVWKKWPGLFPRFEQAFYLTALLAAAWLIVTTVGHAMGIPYFVNVTIPREGSFPNQNIAAGFLGMALLWGAHQKLNHKNLSWFGLGFLLLAWGLTESRGALAAMVLVVVLYLVIHMREVERRISQWTTAQWLVFGGCVLYLVASISLMVNRILNAESVDPRSYFRIDVWISSFKMVWAQPLFGFGPGTYASVYPYYRPAGLWNTLNPFAHNEFLQVAAECGLPALFLVLLLLWAFLREFSVAAWKSPKFQNSKPSFQYAELAFYLVLIETLHNMVDFTFHEWSHRLVLLGFVTFAYREKKAQDDLTVNFQFSRRAFVTCVAVIVLFIGWTLGVGGLRDYLARIYDFKSVLLQQSGDLDGAEVFARKSLAFRSNDMDPWNSLGVIEDARASVAQSPEAREKYFSLADESFQKAIQCSPHAVDPQVNQVQSLIKRGRLSQALDLQNQLVDKGPEMPSSYADLARILLKMGRAKEAIAPAQKMIDQYPYFLPGYFLKAEALETLGRKKDALKAFEDAQQMLKNLNLPDPSGQVQPNIDRLQGRS